MDCVSRNKLIIGSIQVKCYKGATDCNLPSGLNVGERCEVYTYSIHSGQNSLEVGVAALNFPASVLAWLCIKP